LANLLDGLEQRGSSLAQLQREGGKNLKAAVRSVAGLFQVARALTKDDKAPPADRLVAVRLLGRGPDGRKEDLALLAGLLVPQTAGELQAGAVEALARLNDPGVPALLLRGWKGHSPGLRAQVLDVLLLRAERVGALLKALEAKRVLPQDLDAARRQRLLGHKDRLVRARAAKVLAGAVDADRQKVVDRYLPALKLKGDPAKGKALFARTCAACHRLAGVGNEVGPDLAALADRPGDYLLIAIFDPNRAVEARYLNYQAELKDGRVLVGILAAETGASITLIGADGKPVVVPRASLDSLTSTGKSAMPEGLERDLRPQDVADLFAHLRSARSAVKPRVLPGNKPEVVRAGPDGALRLRASNAEVYGRTLVVEKQYGNLGQWSSADDRAAWEVEVPRAGKYAVTFDYACDPGAAGNAWVLEAEGGRLAGKVASTGSWDTYRQVRVGTIALAAGRQRVVLRAEGAIKGALIDLKEARLVAEK
jgi:putative heme-binding domain-containing protein